MRGLVINYLFYFIQLAPLNPGTSGPGQSAQIKRLVGLSKVPLHTYD